MSLGSRPPALDALGGARLASVEASAGTGKTYLLERAALEFVLQGHPIESLLIVTYTERATGELRRRVRALLQVALALSCGDPSEVPAGWDLSGGEPFLRRALEDFEGATLTTIHGFCARLLREHALLLGRGLDESLIAPKEAFGRAFRHVLREALAEGQAAAELQAWLSQRSVEDLEELLWRVDRHRAAELRPPLDEARLLAAGATLARCLDPASLSVCRAELEAGKIHKSTRTAALKRLDGLEETLRAWRRAGWGGVGGEGVPVLALCGDRTLERARDYLCERADKILPAAPSLGPLLDALRDLAQAGVPFEAAAAQRILPKVRARRAREAEERAEHDFDEILEGVARGLRPEATSREALIRAVRARYRLALVDEAQDTDPIQWEVFRALFVEDLAGAPESGLWLIGDPKQAIYGFRGADVYTYLGAQSELEQSGAPRVPLQTTFRSTPALTGALNLLLAEGEPLFHEERIKCAPAVAGRSEARFCDGEGLDLDPVVLLRFPAGSWTAEGVRQAHAQALAAEVSALCAGQHFVVDPGEDSAPGSGGEPRALVPSEIAVLARSGRELTTVAAALRRAGVPSAFLKQDGLFQTREAEDFLHVLRAVLEPHRRALRYRAWNTAFFGVELADLPRCAELPAEHPLLARLFSWSRRAAARDYPGLLRGLLEESGLLEREVLLRQGERELTNYLHLAELLLEVGLRERLEARELTERLASWVAGERLPPGEDGGVQRLEADARAVQLLTIHKSKGLEAEVVFLFGGISDPPQDDLYLFHRWGELDENEPGVALFHEGLERIVHVGPLSPELKDRVRVEQEDEQRRLLYVALTRARCRLYLPCFEEVDEGWSYKRLGGIQRHLSERLLALEARVPEPLGYSRRVVEPASQPDPERPLRARLRDWEVQLPRPFQPALPELVARLSPRVRLSFTRIRSAVEDEPAAGQALGEDPELQSQPRVDFAALSPPPGATSGTLLHELLEHLEWSGATSLEDFSAEQREAVERALDWASLEARHAESVTSLLYGALRTPLVLPEQRLELPEGLWKTEGAREMDFTLPLPEAAGALLGSGFGDRVRAEGGFVVGSIDYLFLHRGRGYLVDWKSNALVDYDPETLEATTAEHYALQRELYALALAKTLGVNDAASYEERFGGVIYLYLRGCDPGRVNAGASPWRPTYAALAEVEARLVGIGHDPRWRRV